MIRTLGIILIAALLSFAWAPVQASPLPIVYSANTYGVYSPCPS